jgi:hypothetical protein
MRMILRSVTSLCAMSLVAGLTIATSACDEKLSTVTGPSADLKPSLSSISKEIFETTDSAGRQACIACHTNVGRTPAGGLNLVAGSAYASLVGAASAQKPGEIQVIPGNPDNSYLIKKLEGDTSIVGRRMPRNGPPYLTSGQILVIRRWIELGAKND